jgi:hypothetical protein
MSVEEIMDSMLVLYSQTMQQVDVVDVTSLHSIAHDLSS